MNSIGDAGRPQGRTARNWSRTSGKHEDSLDEDRAARLNTNPLRILDTKNPAMQELIEGAPRLADHLGEATCAHFEALKELLERCGIAYRVNRAWCAASTITIARSSSWSRPTSGAQSTIAGGGRYDGLFEQLGGKPTTACGFGMGIERVLLVLAAAGVTARDEPDAFVVHAGEAAELMAWKVGERLRDAGLAVVLGAGGSFKSQMKKADASGARYAVILGEDEAASDRITLKPLRGAGEQRTLGLNEAIEHIR